MIVLDRWLLRLWCVRNAVGLTMKIIRPEHFQLDSLAMLEIYKVQLGIHWVWSSSQYPHLWSVFLLHSHTLWNCRSCVWLQSHCHCWPLFWKRSKSNRFQFLCNKYWIVCDVFLQTYVQNSADWKEDNRNRNENCNGSDFQYSNCGRLK